MNNALHSKDVYKIGHIGMYPKGTTEVYSNFTARSGKYSNVPDSKGIYFIGLQYFIMDYLINEWNDTFFKLPKELVVKKYQRRASNILGYEVNVAHIEALHDIGYLPIIIKAIPEGEFIPYNVPMLTIKNTLPEFYWLTNMLESVISAELWQPITSATTYMAYKRIFHKYAEITGSEKEFIPYQIHDFSYRGMPRRHAAAISGFSVLAAGAVGSDCVPGVDIAEDYYGADSDNEVILYSVPATEHSVCSSNIIGDYETPEFYELCEEFLVKKSWDHEYPLDNKLIAEYAFIKNLITVRFPTGIISNVSDTFDFWGCVTEVLPRLKDEIMSREGKYMVRPDSGIPEDIICGKEIEEIFSDNIENAKRWAEDFLVDYISEDAGHGECGMYSYSEIFKWKGNYYRASVEVEWNRYDKQYYYIDGHRLTVFEEVDLAPEQKGLIECLWEIFGGTINEAGYKVLDSHIGAIYGDSITIQRAEQILDRLEKKGFASENIIFGIGSMAYQYVTRDTHGMAIKCTNVIVNGVSTPIFKDPKTGDGTKKSAKGYLMVTKDSAGYKLEDCVDSKAEKRGCLETVFKDGVLMKCTTLAEIRERTKL